MQSFWSDKLEKLGIVVLVPTYNNAGTLASVLHDIEKFSRKIILINDGSTDETSDVLKQFPDIQIITHSLNKGKGRSLRNGLLMAKKSGYRYAISIDSDGQHFASDIPLFVQAIEQTPDALIVGARNMNSDNMPGKNTFANKFSNFWFRLETGIDLEDTQSGFRLYPLHKLNSMKYFTARYEFELEVLVFAAWSGVPVMNIPVNVYYPPPDERISHFRPFRDFLRISILNTVLVLMACLWIIPKRFLHSLTPARIKEFFEVHFIHSGESNIKITLSVMLGVFMGVVPVWGYQMIIALFLAYVFKLNKIITLVASNISIPPLIPFILYGSYATGCMILNRPVVLNYSDISLQNIKTVLEQYLIGSFVFGLLSSVVLGCVVYCLLLVFKKARILPDSNR